MNDYINLVRKVLLDGEKREDRTGVGTRSVFGGVLEFDLRRRFPLLQHKETRYKVAFLEMLWFLRGEDNTDWLKKHGCKLWDAWADEEGYLGPIYGVNWRSWQGINGHTDQIRQVIEGIINDPHGRRHLVSAWKVDALPRMALPPCHWAHQLYASEGEALDMMVYQRSWDLGLGAPFNIAQYALLLHLYARATGRYPRFLKFCYGDAHIYLNHESSMRIMVAREVPPDWCTLKINTDNTDIDGYKPEDFEIEGYWPKPFMPLEVAV